MTMEEHPRYEGFSNGVSNVTTEIESKVFAVAVSNEYDGSKVSHCTDSKKNVQIHPISMFSLHLAGGYPDLLIEHAIQPLMVASDGMKKLNGFDFGVKPNKGLHPKWFESILHQIRGLIGCFTPKGCPVNHRCQ